MLLDLSEYTGQKPLKPAAQSLFAELVAAGFTIEASGVGADAKTKGTLRIEWRGKCVGYYGDGMQAAAGLFGYTFNPAGPGRRNRCPEPFDLQAFCTRHGANENSDVQLHYVNRNSNPPERYLHITDRTFGLRLLKHSADEIDAQLRGTPLKFLAVLNAPAQLEAALAGLDLTEPQRTALRQLYAAADGIAITRDTGGRLQGPTIRQCSTIGSLLTKHVGVGPTDALMWIGTVSGDVGAEIWRMRTEVRSAMEALGWISATGVERGDRAHVTGTDAEQSFRLGQVVDNAALCAQFGCSPQGGMRRALKSNTLVLISNHVESIYDDRWHNGVFHYTGMGQLGDQSLQFMQNKTLAESDSNGVAVHLFEVDTPLQYRYQGRVALAAAPYAEKQPDSTGRLRTVWMFPLKSVSGHVPPLDGREFQKSQKQREKKARRLSDAELMKRAAAAPKTPGQRTTISTSLERDPYVAEVAKRRAKGICQLCEQAAPFQSKDGEPYLESHHIQWLSNGGEDSLANTVALCPNCHRKMHVVASAADRSKLLRKVAQFSVLALHDVAVAATANDSRLPTSTS